MKNRYLLMAQDYMWLADLNMTSRFPAPWRIVDIADGFAVNDATGQQLAVFYGLAEPNAARQTDFLTIDEARQMAVDFARLPERLDQASGRSKVATSPELRHTAQLPAVAGPRLAEMPTIIAKSTSFEPDEWMSTALLPRPSNSLSNRTKLLITIVIAVAALPVGYVVVRNFDRPIKVAAVPQQARTDIPPAEFSSAREPEATSAKASGDAVERSAEPAVQTAPLPVPLDTKPTDGDVQAAPPQVLPERERQSFATRRNDSTCLPSASAVRQNHPGAWPSWTLRAPGHENTICWYAAARTTARDHR
jgi:hypothetical protein